MKSKAITVSLLFAPMLVMMLIYNSIGGALLKGMTSVCFVLMGAVGLMLSERKGVSRFVFIALTTSMVGDVVLQRNFIIGALIFALGHVFYFVSFCRHSRFEAADSAFILSVFAISVFVIFTAGIEFGSVLMTAVCIVYTLIISAVVGKAIRNAIKLKSAFELAVLIGSILFFISDTALMFYIFAGNESANTICLFTYFPAQFILASSTLFSPKGEVVS